MAVAAAPPAILRAPQALAGRPQLLRRFRAQKLKEREDLRTMRDMGEVVRGRHNTRLRGLGNRRLNPAFELLGRILDEAVERELDHPALWIGEPDSVRCGSA